MWNSDKSINLTHFFVRVFYALLAVLAIAAPFLIENESLNGIFSFANDLPKMYLIPFYISVPAGFAALVCLDKLLRNLKNEVVFDCLNVRPIADFKLLLLFCRRRCRSGRSGNRHEIRPFVVCLCLCGFGIICRRNSACC